MGSGRGSVSSGLLPIRPAGGGPFPRRKAPLCSRTDAPGGSGLPLLPVPACKAKSFFLVELLLFQGSALEGTGETVPFRSDTDATVALHRGRAVAAAIFPSHIPISWDPHVAVSTETSGNHSRIH